MLRVDRHYTEQDTRVKWPVGHDTTLGAVLLSVVEDFVRFIFRATVTYFCVELLMVMKLRLSILQHE